MTGDRLIPLVPADCLTAVVESGLDEADFAALFRAVWESIEPAGDRYKLAVRRAQIAGPDTPFVLLTRGLPQIWGLSSEPIWAGFCFVSYRLSFDVGLLSTLPDADLRGALVAHELAHAVSFACKWVHDDTPDPIAEDMADALAGSWGWPIRYLRQLHGHADRPEDVGRPMRTSRRRSKTQPS